MFTGIISEVGYISTLKKSDNTDLIIEIAINHHNLLPNLKIGCSISCNGICLTLIEKKIINDKLIASFQASNETQNKTTISNWKLNQAINIEFSLKIGDEIGGHMVLGHIDTIVKVTNIVQIDESWIFTFKLPINFVKHIAVKGSVTINGTSLTVNNIDNDTFSVNIIPYTYQNTNFNAIKVNDMVNIEIDMISRYLERLITNNE
jgi:riboflavin synthase